MNIYAIIDGAGVYGSLFHYALVIAFVSSAFLIFLYLRKINGLNMDEIPKLQMMQEEEIKQGDDIHGS